MTNNMNEKFYNVVRIGHVNDSVTELNNARIVSREPVEYRPEGTVKRYRVEYASGRTTEYFGMWGSEDEK
ncbi:MAG: hypothetical protein J6U54_15925 [Clostridiales bacterium]|nr:hypothetical protein [Clostridiales bacterium]